MNLLFGFVVIFLVSIIYFVIYYLFFYKKNVQIMSKMIGKVGITIKPIRKNRAGMVKIGVSYWKAKTDDNQIINKGMRVQVIRVENNILIVKSNVISDIDDKISLNGVANL